MSRREVLKVGGLACLSGFGLPELLRAEESRARRCRAKSVILLYLLGGAATQDMVDLKPAAPDGVRGEFRPIATSAPGLYVCEHLPRMARWMHKIAVVRSLNHRAGCHNPLPSYTGLDQMLPDIVSTRDTYPPSMGSVVESLRRDERDLPDYVYMPCYLGWGQAIRRPGPYAGFLGHRFDPLCTEVVPYLDPGTPAESPGHPQVVRGEPHLPHSVLQSGLTVDRLNDRHGLLDQVDAQLRRLEAQRSLDNFSRSQQRAFGLLTSSQARAAFDLSREDIRLRERYGRTLFGNCTLIARRLVEAGVRFVNVTWDIFWDRYRLQYDGWDTHTRNFPILREYNLPIFELAFTSLLQDLQDRGLLDETLVVVMSEMGRTPRVNPNGGRDHWTSCYSMFMAGGGIRGGSAYGESDAQAAYVKDRPVSPADVCATIYECLGIDPDMPIHDRSGRPIPVAHGGRPIR
jgi:uncharacterized protein (DUF1501 family)